MPEKMRLRATQFVVEDENGVPHFVVERSPYHNKWWHVYEHAAASAAAGGRLLSNDGTGWYHGPLLNVEQLLRGDAPSYFPDAPTALKALEAATGIKVEPPVGVDGGEVH